VVENLRNRQVKNLLTSTMLSLGMPMILMGDEARRTQRGNNNAYCQDNEISWFDWTLISKHADVYRFLKLLIARRLLRDGEAEYQPESLNQLIRESIKAWHGVKLCKPDWSYSSHSVVLSAELKKEKQVLHLILNAYWEPLDFELPPGNVEGGGPWRRWIDTALNSPHDIVPWQAAEPFTGQTYRAAAHSVVALYAPLGIPD
jgi:glycogen operon protein